MKAFFDNLVRWVGCVLGVFYIALGVLSLFDDLFRGIGMFAVGLWLVRANRK